MGFSIASLIQSTMMAYTFFLTAHIASFGLGCYLIGITVTKEINGVLQIADKRLRSKRERSLAKKRFTELIKWHSIIKQLSKLEVSNLVSVIST